MKRNWQNQVLVAPDYRELGIFNDAAQALEDIEPEERTRKEVLGARVDLYIAAAVAGYLVKVEP